MPGIWQLPRMKTLLHTSTHMITPEPEVCEVSLSPKTRKWLNFHSTKSSSSELGEEPETRLLLGSDLSVQSRSVC